VLPGKDVLRFCQGSGTRLLQSYRAAAAVGKAPRSAAAWPRSLDLQNEARTMRRLFLVQHPT